jgi:hypothetical protein
MKTILDSRAPATVKAAAIIISVTALVGFAIQALGTEPQELDSFQTRWWPWPQLIGLAVALMVAWGLVRLDGLTYWFAVLILGIPVVAGVVVFGLAAFGVSEEWPMARAGVMGWAKVLALLAAFVLLVMKTSVRAPWSLSKESSRR